MAKNYTKKQVLDAMNKCNGSYSAVADSLNCSAVTAKKYVNKWNETQEAFEVSRSKLIAVASRSFMGALKAGERWAVERVLDTIGRDEGLGLVQKHEIDSSVSGDMKIEIKYVD